jgi:hypothetical protein
VYLRVVMHERELTAPVAIAHADGRLNREAVGWARRPIFDCRLALAVTRAHTWSYWSVMNRSCALSVLFADVGVAGVALVSFQDLAARSPVERVYLRPLGLPVRMPDTPTGDLVLDARRMRLALRACDESTHDLRIEGEMRTLLGRRIELDVHIDRPKTHETLNVLVPFDDECFQLTSKQQGLPARGVVRIDGREHRFEQGDDRDAAFACLDFGRGRRPSHIDWCWAFASARRDGRTVGLNLGGKWTDGTGVTENGIVIDGRLHKVSDDVDFTYDRRDYSRPWQIRTRRTKRVDLRFVPLRERAVRVPLVLADFELHQCVGFFSGTVVDDEGIEVALDDVIGQAERFRGRW